MRKSLKKVLSIFLGLMIIVTFVPITAMAATGGNPKMENISMGFKPAIDTYDKATQFLSPYALVSGIQTIIDENGNIVVAVDGKDSTGNDSNTVKIYEFGNGMVNTKTITLTKTFPDFGAFAKDSAGNYYMFTGKPIREGAGEHEDLYKNVQNMAITKYDANGTLIKETKLNGNIEDGAPDSFRGVKRPFEAGNCKMEINNGIAYVYFARLMYKSPDNLNHQASYGIAYDTTTLEKISGEKNPSGYLGAPYSSHSFDEFILKDGNDFITVDAGDAYPRAFMISRVSPSASTKSIEMFNFKEYVWNNNIIFSQLGGVVKTNSGYMVLGTYEKNTSTASEHNDSRNIVLQTVGNALTETSRGQVKWLTNYTNKTEQNATNPKIVTIGTNEHCVLWEESKATASNGSYYVTTYMATINDNGDFIKQPTQIKGFRLNRNDTLRYNSVTNKVYWATNINDQLILNELDFSTALSESTGIANVTVKDLGGNVISGATVKTADGQTFAVNADVHTATLPIGNSALTISKNGYETSVQNVTVYENVTNQDVILLGAFIGYTVRDAETTNSIGGATVKLNDGTPVPETSSGWYSTREKPTGRYSAVVSKVGYITRTFQAMDFTAFSGSSWIIDMQKRSHFNVEVVDEDGGPINNVTVKLDGENEQTGNYFISYSNLLAGYYDVSVSAPGYKEKIINVLFDTSNQTLTVELEEAEPEDVLPTEINLSKTSETVEKGETVQLTATVMPENATDKTVTWSSLNSTVASVDQNGLVTAKAKGSTTITAATVNGLTTNFVITVNETILPISIELNKVSQTVEKGETVQLTATVMPENATDKTVTWSSLNSTVASVDQNGLVTAKAKGSTTITAATVNGLTTNFVITVNETILPISVSLDKNSETVEKGETVQLTAIILPENATDKSVTWSSNDESIATVSSTGFVTAKAKGTAVITVRTANNRLASCQVTVNETILPISIELNKVSQTVEKGETVQLTATVMPENATDKSVTWSSLDDSIASVDANGLVRAKAKGSTTITARTVNGLTTNFVITVNEKIEATDIELDKNTGELKEGKTLQLTATVLPEDATDKTVIWSSSNDTVASVDENGLVTANAPGGAIIRARLANGSAVAICSITVSSTLPTGINFVTGTLTLEKGQIVPLAPIITPEDATDKSVILTSDNMDVASINENGFVVAKAAGTAIITAETVNGLTATCTINVIELGEKEIFTITPMENQVLVNSTSNIKIITSKDVDSIKLSDSVFGIFAILSVQKEELTDTIEWTAEVKFNLRGKRDIVIDAYVGDEKVASESAQTNVVTIKAEAGIASLIDFNVNKTAAKLKEEVTIVVKTSKAVSSVMLYNEANSGIAKMSETIVDDETTRTFTIKVAFSTKGTRTITVKVMDENGEYKEEYGIDSAQIVISK